GEKLQQALDVIYRNAELEARLVDDILDASRIISGKLKLDFQPTSVNEIMRLLVQSWQPVAETKGITLVADLQPVPIITANAQRLQQIFANLLSNAFKFTDPGGEVRLSLHQANSSVQVKVSDTGIGIKPDFLPHVFERFRQGDPSSTRR